MCKSLARSLAVAACIAGALSSPAWAEPHAIGPTPVGITQSISVVPAAVFNQNGLFANRTQAQIYNNSTSGNAWCRDDNQAAVVGAGVKIGPGLGWLWVPPNISTYPINCISDAGTLMMGGIYYQ